VAQPSGGSRPRSSARAAHELILDDFGFTLARVLNVPPMAGRIWAELILTTEPHLSLAQIREAVGASAGSSSEMTRLLLREGVIERVVVPGDRKDYFRLAPDLVESCTTSAVASNRMVRELFERSLSRLGPGPAKPRAVMSELAAFYAFMESEIPQLYSRFRDRERRG
jgi:hypothetical protein